MADAEKQTFEYLELGIPSNLKLETPGATPLSSRAEPARYKHLFAVSITDTDPQNLACEIRVKRAPAVKQAGLTKAHFDDVMRTGRLVPTSGLDLKLHTSQDSLVMLHLEENNTVFSHPDHPSDASYAILRKSGQLHMVYQARWLTGASDQKTISMIVREYRPTDYAISYALRVRVEAGTSITYSDIDPKVENEGEG